MWDYFIYSYLRDLLNFHMKDVFNRNSFLLVLIICVWRVVGVWPEEVALLSTGGGSYAHLGGGVRPGKTLLG